MGKIKRGLAALFAAVFAVVLSLGAATPAQADSYAKDVTFGGLGTGDSINAYKLISYSDDTYSGYTIESKFKSFLQSTSNPYNDGVDSGSDDKKLAEWLEGLSSEEVNQVLVSYANNWGNNPPTTFASASSNGGSAKLSFEPGYYMVLARTSDSSTGARLYNPVSLFVKVNGESSTVKVGSAEESADASVSVQLKSQDAPGLDKYLVRADGSLHKTRTVSPGETVKFAVKVQFGQLAGGVDPSPVIHDTLKNLTLNTDSFEVHEVGADGKIGDVTISDAVEYTNKGNGEFELALDWTKISGRGDVKNEASLKTVYVTYTAAVADSIVASADNQGRYVGTNEAYLTYRTSAQQGGESRTNASSTSVYTFAISLEKLDMNGNALSGATFKLHDDTQDKDVKFKKVTDGNGNVTYYVVDASDNSTDTTYVLDAASGTNHNMLDIRGIDCSREYTLTEESAPKGYFKPASGWKLKFASLKDNANPDEHTGNLDAARATSEDSNIQALAPLNNQNIQDATFELDVKNSNLPILPTTGGMGTVLFTVAGVALMVVAAAAFFFVRRRNN